MNKIFLFVILGLFVFLLAGCSSLMSSKTQTPTTQYICSDGKTIVNDASMCPAIDTELVNCDKAAQTTDYTGNSQRNVCYFDLAVQRGNVSLCKNVYTTDSYSSVSAAKCGAEIAVAKNDPTICNDLGIIGSSDCYYEVAKQAGDPNICLQITSSQKRDDCISNYVSYDYTSISDWSICDKMSPNRASDCYYDAATSTQNPSYCDKMGANSLYTQADCYGKIALDTTNPDVCKGLPTTPKQDECYYTYASTYPYNPSACRYIVDQNKKSDCAYSTNRTY